MTAHQSRRLEDVGFLAAILTGAGYVVVESIARLKNIPDPGFPWGMLIMQGVMALPKMIGRVSAGKFWEAIAQRIGK
jgi:hypothetical protein